MSLLTLLLIAGFLIAMGVSSHRSFKELEHRKTAWKALIPETNMRYLPGSFSMGGARMEGKYRGFYVCLDTTKKSGANNSLETFTSIRLVNAPKQLRTYNTVEPANADEAAKLFSRDYADFLWGNCTIEFHHRDLRYLESGLLLGEKQLKSVIDYLCDLAIYYPQIVSLGGEAVTFLRPILSDATHPLKSIVNRLLRDIAYETEAKFGSRMRSVRCKQCLTCFAQHKLNLEFLLTMHYSACRTCKKSQHFYEEKDLRTILVLDSEMKDDVVQRDRFLYVNWLQRKALFDFDEVKIGHTTDEDVSLLAVQIGNDTDPFRVDRYEHMPCKITEPDVISENTQHILRKTFGRVQVKEI